MSEPVRIDVKFQPGQVVYFVDCDFHEGRVMYMKLLRSRTVVYGVSYWANGDYTDGEFYEEELTTEAGKKRVSMEPGVGR